MAHRNEPLPLFVTDEYEDLIVYIRRQKFDTNKIYAYITGNWNCDARDISESVYANAYNGFDHYKDRNYDVNF